MEFFYYNSSWHFWRCRVWWRFVPTSHQKRRQKCHHENVTWYLLHLGNYFFFFSSFLCQFVRNNLIFSFRFAKFSFRDSRLRMGEVKTNMIVTTQQPFYMTLLHFGCHLLCQTFLTTIWGWKCYQLLWIILAILLLIVLGSQLTLLWVG